MIPLILGILTALVQTSFLGALAPTGWQLLLSVAVIVYLYRFGLRRINHRTSWVIGLTLDLFSSWPFGVWLVIILVVDLVADLALPKRTTSVVESTGALLVFGLTAALTIGINLVNGLSWFGNAIWSGLLVTLLYYVATRATISWRIYE